MEFMHHSGDFLESVEGRAVKIQRWAAFLAACLSFERWIYPRQLCIRHTTYYLSGLLYAQMGDICEGRPSA